MREILNDDGVRLLAEALRPANGAVLGKWIEEGRCAEVDPELWFPPKGYSDKEAKAICGECEVRETCRAGRPEAVGRSDYEQPRRSHVVREPERHEEGDAPESSFRVDGRDRVEHGQGRET